MDRLRRTKFVVGTRGSELAVIQTEQVLQALEARWAGLKCEMKIIKTRGDDKEKVVEDARAGRKGLFTGTIERALVEGAIDFAVHSAKDLPSSLAPGTEVAAVLPRAPIGDVLVATTPSDLDSLARDGIVATGSVRRKHQLHWKRPDLEIVDLHGNVPTRLRKLGEDLWHGIILARAGLERLGLWSANGLINFENKELWAAALPKDVFVPAGGQGVIAIQTRQDDEQLKETLGEINDFDTRLCLRAEREFLRLLNADCNQPVGVVAEIEGTVMNVRGQIFHLDATTPREASVVGPSEDAEKLAAKLFSEINGH
jgi:hydroxymethylbilane synthase